MNNLRNDKIPSGYRTGQLQQFTPQQLKLFKQMFSRLSPDSDLSRMAEGDEEFFDEMEAPAMRQFNQLQGGLASRFSNMGMGARRSSGFQNTSTAAASNFAQDLASKRQGLQRQAMMDLMGLSENLLAQRPNERFLVPKKQNQTAEMVGKFGGLIPGLISSASGGGSSGSAVKGALSSWGG